MNKLKREEVEQLILAECNALAQMLLGKNRSYGNSALNPVRIFSTASAVAGLEVRIDDKLSRIASRQEAAYGEDTLQDLLGYFILLRIARRLAVEKPEVPEVVVDTEELVSFPRAS